MSLSDIFKTEAYATVPFSVPQEIPSKLHHGGCVVYKLCITISATFSIVLSIVFSLLNNILLLPDQLMFPAHTVFPNDKSKKKQYEVKRIIISLIN